MSFLLAFAGFAALIVLHELGHMLAAKAVGMRVERFALFFPPLIARYKRGETEYAIGATPLGGYVKITGMSPREEIPEEHAHRAYYLQPVWKRIVVIAAGPAVNLAIALGLAWALVWSQGIVEPRLAVGEVNQGSPAQAAGIQPGDRLVAIEDQRLAQPGLDAEQIGERQQAFRDATARAEGPVRLVVARPGGPERTVEVTPRFDRELERPLIGITFATETVDVGPGAAAEQATDRMWEVAKLTVTAIVRLFYDARARDEVSGVVGSYEVTRQAIEFDTALALNILAIISLSLAIINLFPFLPLDGGHIFWALAEKLRGRRIPFEVMERASIVGFVLVVCLFAIGLTNDIERLAGEGFNVR